MLPSICDVCLPTQFWFNIGLASQPIAAVMPTIVYDAGPALLQHWVCFIPSPANTCHSPNTVSKLAQRIRRWSNMEKIFGDCLVFGETGHCMWVTLPSSCRQKSHYPDNTIYWPNVDVMLETASMTLGQHYSNLIRLSSNHEYNCEYVLSEHFLDTQLFDLATSNVIFALFIRAVSQKCQPFPTHDPTLSAN